MTAPFSIYSRKKRSFSVKTFMLVLTLLVGNYFWAQIGMSQWRLHVASGKAIDVVLAVLSTTSFNTLKLSCFFINDSKIAPIAPTPADSVGVANPPKIDPKTATIKIKGGKRALNTVL